MSAAPATIRVLIIDDSTLVREGLRVVLSSETGQRRMEVIGEAGSVGAGVEAAKRLKPDVVLLDVRLPDGSGVDACRARPPPAGAPTTRPTTRPTPRANDGSALPTTPS